ncbi:hypothetical protein [Paracoccus acridae]|uniref:hypothetical protein n=1 Tax=Paracoccus acridae TaxID=1795310 RepID=UPI00166683FE|nr:hypothetical protein [Paracoccus acridae]
MDAEPWGENAAAHAAAGIGQTHMGPFDVQVKDIGMKHPDAARCGARVNLD